MRNYFPAFLCLVCSASLSAESPVLVGASFSARDSLDAAPDSSSDAQECLDGLIWDATSFTVRCEAPRTEGGDMLVFFPTPRPSGDHPNDRVAMEWYVARNDDRKPVKAPAVVVVHESGRDMTAGRIFARGIQSSGVHAFLVHLPYYGERTTADKHENAETFIAATRQGIADVRRARDAAASIPLVIDSRIGLQGTSLGGFVAATTAGLDDGFDAVFLMLAGGDLYDVIQNGAKDAKQYRDRLAQAGYSGEKLRAELRKVEPNRLAHRLNPEQTWLYSGLFDTVVPIKNARLLAQLARLEKSHHIEMVANHYSGIVFIPFLLGHMSQHFKALEP